MLCSIVHTSVKVNGNRGDDERIFINVNKALFNSVRCANNNSACKRERSVKPGIVYHSAVLLCHKTGVCPNALTRKLHSEGGRVAVRSRDYKACGGLCIKGDYGG